MHRARGDGVMVRQWLGHIQDDMTAARSRNVAAQRNHPGWRHPSDEDVPPVQARLAVV